MILTFSCFPYFSLSCLSACLFPSRAIPFLFSLATLHLTCPYYSPFLFFNSSLYTLQHTYMKIPPMHTCSVLPSYSHTRKRRGPGAQRRFCGSTILHVVYAARDPVEEHRGARCQFSIFTSGGRGPAENTKGRHGMRLGSKD